MELDPNITLSTHAQREIENSALPLPIDATLPLTEQLTTAYDLALIRFPRLQEVQLISDSMHMPDDVLQEFRELPTKLGMFARPTKDNPYVSVYLNPTLTEEQLSTYSSVVPEDLLQSAGIPPQALTENPRAILFFLLFHELGHAEEYILERKRTDLDSTELEVQLSQRRKQELATLPFPDFDPAEVRTLYTNRRRLLETYFNSHTDHFAQQNIHTLEELLDAQRNAYMRLPSERDANSFGIYALKIFWENLGLPPIK